MGSAPLGCGAWAPSRNNYRASENLRSKLWDLLPGSSRPGGFLLGAFAWERKLLSVCFGAFRCLQSTRTSQPFRTTPREQLPQPQHPQLRSLLMLPCATQLWPDSSTATPPPPPPHTPIPPSKPSRPNPNRPGWLFWASSGDGSKPARKVIPNSLHELKTQANSLHEPVHVKNLERIHTRFQHKFFT